MPRARIVRSVAVVQTPRVAQMSGLFDVPPASRSERVWEVDFDLPASWNVGLIVGPSGSGKSTVARELFGANLITAWDWPVDHAVLDGFPARLGIKEVTGLLGSVGFSSPPSWLKPFHVLSTGEQFRVDLARTLAELPELAVVDEFTSVVDRQVAQIGSAAVARAVRRRGQQFIAVTCHYDVAEWLEPDWIYQPHTGEFVAGRLLRRPPIELEIVRVHPAAWELFRPHHYLSGHLHRSAACFVALLGDQPAAFCAVLYFPHPHRPGWKGHRTVCLPDFQGVGIGNSLTEYVGSLYRATGKPYFATTSHPGSIHHRLRSPLWRCVRRSCLARRDGKVRLYKRHSVAGNMAVDRLTAGFEYVGPARPQDASRFGII